MRSTLYRMFDSRLRRDPFPKVALRTRREYDVKWKFGWKFHTVWFFRWPHWTSKIVIPNGLLIVAWKMLAVTDVRFPELTRHFYDAPLCKRRRCDGHRS